MLASATLLYLKSKLKMSLYFFYCMFMGLECGKGYLALKCFVRFSFWVFFCICKYMALKNASTRAHLTDS